MSKMGRVVDRESRDAVILCAILGRDSLDGVNMAIEQDYLLRERMENRRESGREVPDDHLPRQMDDWEKGWHRCQYLLSAAEQERTAIKKEWEDPVIDFDEELDLIPRPIGVKVVAVV